MSRKYIPETPIHLQQERLNEYLDLATYRRGEFLNNMVDLELAIDQYTNNYYLERPDIQNLVQIIRGELGLKSKKEFVLWIIKHNDPLIRKVCPRIDKELSRLISSRNIFAHCQIVDTKFEDYIKKKHTVFKTDDGNLHITQFSFDKLMATVGEYTYTFEREGKFSKDKYMAPPSK